MSFDIDVSPSPGREPLNLHRGGSVTVAPIDDLLSLVTPDGKIRQPVTSDLSACYQAKGLLANMASYAELTTPVAAAAWPALCDAKATVRIVLPDLAAGQSVSIKVRMETGDYAYALAGATSGRTFSFFTRSSINPNGGANAATDRTLSVYMTATDISAAFVGAGVSPGLTPTVTIPGTCPCINGGTCQGQKGLAYDGTNFVCQCPPRYYGNYCQTFCNHGLRLDVPVSGQNCVCDEGWFYQAPTPATGTCSGKCTCLRNSFCDGTDGKCYCKDGLVGPQCDKRPFCEKGLN
jgi:hypothetical protein